MSAKPLKNQRHERFAQFLAAKVAALRKIGGILGMFGNKVPASQVAERRQSVSDGYLLLIAARLLDDTLYPGQRAALGMLLDFYAPDWRRGAPLALLGCVVDRSSPEVRRWRNEVLERDGHKCSRCDGDEELEAHHIVRWVDSPFLRVAPENGTTLCRPCHVREHGHVVH